MVVKYWEWGLERNQPFLIRAFGVFYYSFIRARRVKKRLIREAMKE